MGDTVPSGRGSAPARELERSLTEAEERADRALRQLAATEELGGLGSYDWDVATGELTWSDALFRLYGYEPGDFEPSYERFLEHVHPDDRARIGAEHEHALRTASAFETEERIRRADGQERTLLTTGLVSTDASGRPVRLHGVCRDVTDERHARERARQAATRFETLISASPDAIVVVDRCGRITSVNQQAERLFQYSADELVTMSVDDLVPDHARGRHARLREGFAEEPTARPMAAGADLQAVRSDGTLVPVDIALSPLGDVEDGAVAAFVRDATQRRQAEHDARRVAEEQMRRRQALELNDNVVQGLVTLLWELEGTVAPSVRDAAERTLAAARSMMNDLLEDVPDAPGALIRTTQVSDETEPHPSPPPAPPAPPAQQAPPGTVRVVLADDADDLRTVLRLRLRRLDGIEVVGEAADGRRAVELCEEQRPELVLLDLSMPTLDGLQAATAIRERLPDTRIYILSGYPADAMRARALEAGADAYFEKRASLEDVTEAVRALADRSGPDDDVDTPPSS